MLCCVLSVESEISCLLCVVSYVESEIYCVLDEVWCVESESDVFTLGVVAAAAVTVVTAVSYLQL